MKKMIKLVAGAVTFGVLSGSVFTGTEYALNRVTGSGITQTQSRKRLRQRQNSRTTVRAVLHRLRLLHPIVNLQVYRMWQIMFSLPSWRSM